MPNLARQTAPAFNERASMAYATATTGTDNETEYGLITCTGPAIGLR